MAERNVGKTFEDDFKTSAKEQGIYTYRIKDLAFSQKSQNQYLTVRVKNPCDFFMFGNIKEGRGNLIGLELKSTKYSSIGFQLTANDPDAMIKHHQIEGLRELAAHEGIWAGFLFNFRHENSEETYFLDIKDFDEFLKGTTKKSINTGDIQLYDGLKINQELKRKHYRYNVQAFIEDLAKRKGVN